MADIKKLILPNGVEYNLRDAQALPLTGGTLTGGLEGTTAEFTDITTGNLLVTGSLSITNMTITQAEVDALFV